MSYLGRVTNKSSDIRRIDITSSTSATHTLTWTAPTEQSLIVTINGVKQQNNYTVSGTTLTLDTALISTDKLEVIGINDIGTTITPAQGSVNTDQLATDAVSTVKIQDDAVTADKLANAINTSIAANTAKVTNATHTGDVTGATALTIATDAVDIAMLSATGSASSSTFLRGDNAWAAAGGDNTPSFFAKRGSNQAISASTWTKVQFDTEEWDTASAYDNSTNYRFTVPSGEAGKYFLRAAARVAVTSGAGAATNHANLVFYLNGVITNNGYSYSGVANSGHDLPMSATAIFDLSVSDYIEVYVWENLGTDNLGSGPATSFSGFKLIGA